jgi:hypothetical protein
MLVLPLRPLLLALLAAVVAAPVGAGDAPHRFGPWRGGCDPTCTLATPVEFGARLHVAPAADGGLAVAVTPVEPAPGTPVRFDFGGSSPPITVAAAGWRADGGGRLTLTDPHDRAVVLERLPVAATTTVRWTPRSGEPRAAEIPTAEAGEALAWLTEATGRRVRVVDPEAPRVSWASDPRAFVAGVEACRGDGGHEVVRVVGAARWTESQDAVVVVDGEGVRRRCVVRRGEDVVTGWERHDERGPPAAGPILTLPPAGPCYAHETLRDADGGILGVLSEARC